MEERRAAEERQIRQRREAEEEREREERLDRERERIEEFKENLSAEEREKLRKEAVSELKGYNPEFVSELLIEIKENEILRKRLDCKDENVEKSPSADTRQDDKVADDEDT